MSEILSDMKKLASGYLANKVSLDDFRGDFAGLYFRARERKHDKDANSLASKIMGPLAEFSRQHRNEKSLRGEIEAALRPFESPVFYRTKMVVDLSAVHPSSWMSGNNSYGVNPKPAGRANDVDGFDALCSRESTNLMLVLRA